MEGSGFGSVEASTAAANRYSRLVTRSVFWSGDSMSALQVLAQIRWWTGAAASTVEQTGDLGGDEW